MSRRKSRDAYFAMIREQSASEKFDSRRSKFFRIVAGAILAFLTLTLVAAVAIAERPAPTDRETVWSGYLAEQMGGQAEVRLPDRSRADIMTDTTAWEVEWSDKWPESIGQSLNYMIEGNKPKAGIILLCRGNWDHDYQQCKKVVAFLNGRGVPIHVEVVEVK